MKNKKGLSAIVATLMIILLAIVAIGILWVAVGGFFNKNAETIDLKTKCLDVDLKATKVIDITGSVMTPEIPDNPNTPPNEFVAEVLYANGYDITISRNVGGDFIISGVQIVIDDVAGQNREVKDVVEDMDVLYKKTHSFELVEGFTPGTVKLIPSFTKEAGDTYYCKESFVFEIPQPVPTSA